MKIIIHDDPYGVDHSVKWYGAKSKWPCQWIACSEDPRPPFVSAFRLSFETGSDIAPVVHVGADERYILYLDGHRIGRGNDRGDANNWYYDSYRLTIPRGAHRLVALVWSLGHLAPHAQVAVRPGFILSPEKQFVALLGTGQARWEARMVPGYEFRDSFAPTFGIGPGFVIHGDLFPWNVQRGDGEGWLPAQSVENGMNGLIQYVPTGQHPLKPSLLPAMREKVVSGLSVVFVAEPPTANTRPLVVRREDHRSQEVEGWMGFVRGIPLVLPAGTRRRVLVDLGNYYCAYPEIVISGGSNGWVRLAWAESLFMTDGDKDQNNKGNRDQIIGKYFRGIEDRFHSDGGDARHYELLWWRSGRYMELVVESGETPMTLEQITLTETHYPLTFDSTFDSDQPRLQSVFSLCSRSLQMCMHETYMDCPYYEQLMYSGDGRLEALTNYALSRDGRLARKALILFDASRILNGLSRAHYPARTTQIIPSFSLWWIGMVYDYALWRDDHALVRQLLSGVRAVIDGYFGLMNDQGLVAHRVGYWYFMDWVPEWENGMPPDADSGVNALINWQFVLILTLAAELEDALGDPEIAARYRRKAHELSDRLMHVFFDPLRRLFAEDVGKSCFSEHTQLMAILSRQLPADIMDGMMTALMSSRDLYKTTISFTHYLFEMCYARRQENLFFKRLRRWDDHFAMGFKTTMEKEEPSRSDCHGWSAHPIYHCFATILGIRPAAFGFRSVTIQPMLGPLRYARGHLVHPRGDIEVELRKQGEALEASISLPLGISGVFHYGNAHRELAGGKHSFCIKP